MFSFNSISIIFSSNFTFSKRKFSCKSRRFCFLLLTYSNKSLSNSLSLIRILEVPQRGALPLRLLPRVLRTQIAKFFHIRQTASIHSHSISTASQNCFFTLIAILLLLLNAEFAYVCFITVPENSGIWPTYRFRTAKVIPPLRLLHYDSREISILIDLKWHTLFFLH